MVNVNKVTRLVSVETYGGVWFIATIVEVCAVVITIC